MANEPNDPEFEHTLSDDANYTEDSIQILEGIEAVRKRPAMYIGDTAETGLHHLVYEVIDNAIDEALAGRCDTILVELQDDGSCGVTDNGSGIPVGMHPKAKKSTLEVVMTVLHAGGKFERDGEAAYKVSGGLHGVGVSCVNALSEWMEAEVSRDGHQYTQRYQRGIPVTEVERHGKTDRTGTRIVFKPDGEIFETTRFSFDVLAKRIRQLAFLNKGVTIKLVDHGADPRREEVFHYAGGISAFVAYLNEGKQTFHEVISIEGRDEEARVEVEVAFQYNNGFRDDVFSFVNNIHTVNGGTHLSGLRSAMTRQLNRHAQDIAGKKDKIPTGDDYREGLTCVLSVKVPEPQFEGQTKGKLGNREVHGIVESIVNTQLASWIEENPKDAKTIVQKAMQAARVRDAVRKARDLARRKGALSGGGLPGKLWDCSSKKVEETEIFIVEGDSAGGSAKQGRDHKNQAILPIKGKILNVEKASLDRLLGHDEIKTLISALGTGIHDDFSADKLRYGKVIIMTDADVDGSHIRTLLLTFFFRHMESLIESGRIYAAQPPLYRVKKKKKKERYVTDDNELRSILLSMGIDGTTLRSLEEGEVYEGERLTELMEVLEQLEEHTRYVVKRGVRFDDYLAARAEDGTLPRYQVRTPTEHAFLIDDSALERWLTEHEVDGEEPRHLGSEEFPEASETHVYWRVEFLSKHKIEETLRRLQGFGLSASEHYLENGVTDPRFRLECDGEVVAEVTTLKETLEAVRRVGQKGLDIQRYKGLGEMNADQLWETTMDPEKRTLVRIRLVDGAKANNMFSVLMGDQVEPRRRFIERHALDVKYLDV